jgi:hypothetical protein
MFLYPFPSTGALGIITPIGISGGFRVSLTRPTEQMKEQKCLDILSNHPEHATGKEEKSKWMK